MEGAVILQKFNDLVLGFCSEENPLLIIKLLK